MAGWTRESATEPMVRVGVILDVDAHEEVRLTVPNGGWRIGTIGSVGTALNVGASIAVRLVGDALDAGEHGKAGALRIWREMPEELAPGVGVLVRDVVAGRGFHWQKNIDQTLPGEIELSAGRQGVVLVNVLPLEAYPHGPVPAMTRHLERVGLAESLGFSAIWLRDVPFNVPSFGDAGQLYDPFVYLGLLAGQTQRIALGVASIVLPLRHPAHVAKAAASADVLSGGRLILGVASGDRPEEYPALNLPFADRGERFRDSFDYIQHLFKFFVVFYGTPGCSHANSRGAI